MSNPPPPHDEGKEAQRGTNGRMDERAFCDRYMWQWQVGDSLQKEWGWEINKTTSLETPLLHNGKDCEKRSMLANSHPSHPPLAARNWGQLRGSANEMMSANDRRSESALSQFPPSHNCFLFDSDHDTSPDFRLRRTCPSKCHRPWRRDR